jgi:hypothetical protein
MVIILSMTSYKGNIMVIMLCVTICIILPNKDTHLMNNELI